MMAERGTIAVAGAGIGGLTAALHLSRVGFRVVIVERADDLREVGAGLQISPNASRILIDLGLRDRLARVAAAPERLRLFSTRAGGEINHVDLGAAAEIRFGAPYWVVHRGDLHRILLDAAAAEPLIDIRLGTRLENAADDGTRVTVTVAEGSRETAISANALIGADGVWSTVRGAVFRLGGAAFTGRTAWRATLPVSAVAADFRADSVVWFGADAHLVHYPIHGGSQFNIVAATVGDWSEEGWNAPGDRDEIMAHFADWPKRARNLISLPEQWLKWALCGMPTGRSWHRGRIALLGDAAHAMLPFAAQGAAMAIEDAAVLARKLDTSAEIATALRRYEAERRPRVERIVETALENDRIYHLSGAAAFARDKGIQLASPRRLLARYDWIYGWKTETRRAA